MQIGLASRGDLPFLGIFEDYLLEGVVLLFSAFGVDSEFARDLGGRGASGAQFGGEVEGASEELFLGVDPVGGLHCFESYLFFIEHIVMPVW